MLNNDPNYDVQPYGLPTFNAHHYYRVKFVDRNDTIKQHDIRFQEGPVKEHGVNGITEEILLNIILDRYESFQNSEFKCQENEDSIYHLKYLLDKIKERKEKRIARDVEGVYKP